MAARCWPSCRAPAREDPVCYALAHAVRAHQLPLRPLLELLDTLDDGLAPRHLPDAAAPEHHCCGVAGTARMTMAMA